jgi:murein DD-endopeptidase MepM/ murein hydrolase activator NlpD
MTKTVFTFLFIVFVILLTLLFLSIIKPSDYSFRKPVFDENLIPPEYYNPDLSFSDNSKLIRKGLTIYDLLVEENVPSNLIAESISALNKQKYKILLKPNLRYEIIKNDDGIITNLLIELSRRKRLILEYGPEVIECSIVSIPANIDYSILSAKIKNSLFETLSSLGFSDSLAYELNSIFMWDIDFNTDIHEGDRFIIIFEKIPVSAGMSSCRNILGARFILHGKIFDAIGFYNDKNYFDYYDPHGKNFKKQFLTSPLKFAYISSRFSYRRFHPILKIFRPHLGVDYCASAGTPVHSTGQGKIIFKGWDRGGGGNALKIRHPNGFLTVYMHLRKYAAGIVVNKDVRQGQVIGYVGATGLATGPHLDYRIQKNGKYINPLSLKNPSSGELKRSLQKYFKIHRDRLMKQIDKYSKSDYFGYYNE